MRQLTQQEIQTLQRHVKWLQGQDGGERADLQGAYLRGAYLQGAYLQRADLQGADLRGADLQGADLRGADLQGAYLRGADLWGADLRGAYLQGAYLQGAYLQGAYLWGAYLQGADLQGADLLMVVSQTQACPETGAFDAWKKGASGCIIKLRIPSGAARLTAIRSRKCRASRAIVKAIWDVHGNRINKCGGWHQQSFIYEVGKVVFPDTYNADPREECSHGIHFHITRKEAEDY